MQTTSRQKSSVTPEDAERIAILAIGYLAGHTSLMERFLALTGLDVGALRSIARSPDFMKGVLEFLLAHEEELIAFGAEASVDPGDVARACAVLAGESGGS